VQKFPIEKDLGSFLRSLSYIKFFALLNFIEKKIIEKDEYRVPEEFLFGLYFRKAAKISQKDKTLETVLYLLNYWELQMMNYIFDKSLKLDFTLINYFTIERALHELNYELLYRPNKLIIPILGLKELIDKV
jgi:predicted trehalose synthase